MLIGGGGIPAFGLEPKFAPQISIGALPLWSAFGGHPDDLGELLPQTPSDSNPRGNKKKEEAAVGFEPTNNGFANRRLGPLGYAAKTTILP